MNSIKKKQAMREAVVDTTFALIINFPLNFVLLWIATLLGINDNDSANNLMMTIFLTTVFTIVAIIRKYFMRQWFDKMNQKELQIKA
jgi:Kef-type K+ transport system membrane component KefB